MQRCTFLEWTHRLVGPDSPATPGRKLAGGRVVAHVHHGGLVQLAEDPRGAERRAAAGGVGALEADDGPAAAGQSGKRYKFLYKN